MDRCKIPDHHRETRRRQLAAAHRRIVGSGPETADQTIFQVRTLAAADELDARLADGGGGDLGAEVLWTLVSLAPMLLEPPPRSGAAVELYPHPELLDGRETAQRLRGFVAAYEAAASGVPRVAAGCRLLALMLETVEQLTRFPHPGGVYAVVSECFEVLGAGAAFLESTVEGAASGS